MSTLEQDRQEADRDFWRLLAGFLLPPLGVFLQVGIGLHFWINVLLTVLLPWVGGQIHAAWVITNTDAHGQPEDRGMERFIAVLLSGYLPPLGVLLTRGLSMALLLNALLTACLWIPGTVHAFWLVTHDPE